MTTRGLVYVYPHRPPCASTWSGDRECSWWQHLPGAATRRPARCVRRCHGRTSRARQTRLASALRGWRLFRFEIAEEPSPACEGERYSSTPGSDDRLNLVVRRPPCVVGDGLA